MPKSHLPLPLLLFALGIAHAQPPPEPAAQDPERASIGASEANAEAPTEADSAQPEEPGVKTLSGMSILGNEEAPKSLVIVPWKSSQIGDEVGVANAMDERARPVDKEVFMREVRYYELRSELGRTAQ